MVLPDDSRIVVAGQDVDLPVLLQAVDLVVTLNSTVGLEGHLAGARLIQILGSVFDNAMPLKRYGLADEAVALAVRTCVDKACDLSDMSLADLQKFSPLVGADVFEVLTLEGSVAARNHIGGTAPQQVKLAIARARQQLAT